MIIGVYLVMPLLSPWAQNVGKNELRMILLIWAFTCLIPMNNAGYGMYLMHILLLVPLFGVFRSLFGGFGVDGGILADTVRATPAVVLCTAISTFIGSAVISCLVRRFIPLGHHIVG